MLWYEQSHKPTCTIPFRRHIPGERSWASRGSRPGGGRRGGVPALRWSEEWLYKRRPSRSPIIPNTLPLHQWTQRDRDAYSSRPYVRPRDGGIDPCLQRFLPLLVQDARGTGLLLRGWKPASRTTSCQARVLSSRATRLPTRQDLLRTPRHLLQRRQLRWRRQVLLRQVSGRARVQGPRTPPTTPTSPTPTSPGALPLRVDLVLTLQQLGGAPPPPLPTTTGATGVWRSTCAKFPCPTVTRLINI
ncbi:uncharacterized protein LOC143029614 [Oratosquilla oratoria]|uniref:uncharacterized protein LOC143029614 n=1 Tax=Oratosquilla oratoria TaxID=337810 RepID=UPI003F75D15F